MKVDFSNYQSSKQKPNETDGKTINVISTSAYTAAVSPIILKRTDIVHTKFEPQLIDNPKDKSKSVSGKLIHEKKKKHDEDFPTETISKGNLRVGDRMEITLDHHETLDLFNGLKNLYELHDDIEVIPSGDTTFTRIDRSFKQLHTILQSDTSTARLMGSPENFELVKMLIQLITQTDSIDNLKESLKSLQDENIATLSSAMSIEQYQRAKQLIEDNLDNSDEEFWQKNIFENNQWIISQLFSFPCTIYEKKAYMGGKNMGNHNGNLCDLIYQNNLSQNVALVEIKTPCADIIGQKYRNTYSLSNDMSGAINQVINYRDSLTKEYFTILGKSDNHFEVLNPKCLVIIGKISSLDKNQRATFEKYRNSLSNIIIVTFDEMFEKIKDIIDIFSNKDNFENNDNSEDTSNDFDNINLDEELPF